MTLTVYTKQKRMKFDVVLAWLKILLDIGARL